MKREALKLALEALNDMACWKEGKEVDMGFDEPYAADTSRKTIAAIKEALAQPAQKPMAWVERIGGGVSYDLYHEAARKLPEGVKFDLYTAPPQRTWVGLTDAQAERLYRNISPTQQQDVKSLAAFKRLLRVIEAAHGIKEKT